MSDETKALIRECLDMVDFDVIHSYMHLTRWEWQGRGVPSKDEIIECARSLLTDAAQRLEGSDDCTSFMVSSGGFTAKAYHGETGLSLALGFYIQSGSAGDI